MTSERATVSTADLTAALEEALRRESPAAAIASVERQPSAYRTSFAIEELQVVLCDGSRRAMLLKCVGRENLNEVAQRAKPAFLYDPEREIAVYRSVLADASLGTARCYAWGADGMSSRYWLVLEKFDGVELYQVGEMQLWERAAQWLAGFHATFAPRVDQLEKPARLLRYDRDLLMGWATRAAGFVGEANPPIAMLTRRYDRVVERLASMPVTLLHGEFYASNVLVGRQPGGAVRVCPVDWELAAVGPGLVDLAALTAGKWSAAQRRQIASAYHEELARQSPQAPGLEEMLESLEFCRLHLAMQWLGWSGDWTPPREHAHDWLAEAIELAERLGV